MGKKSWDRTRGGGYDQVAPAPRIIQWDDPPIRGKLRTSNEIPTGACFGVVSAARVTRDATPKPPLCPMVWTAGFSHVPNGNFSFFSHHHRLQQKLYRIQLSYHLQWTKCQCKSRPSGMESLRRFLAGIFVGTRSTEQKWSCTQFPKPYTKNTNALRRGSPRISLATGRSFKLYGDSSRNIHQHLRPLNEPLKCRKCVSMLQNCRENFGRVTKILSTSLQCVKETLLHEIESHEIRKAPLARNSVGKFTISSLFFFEKARESGELICWFESSETSSI